MIPKSGRRFSEKIMLNQNAKNRPPVEATGSVQRRPPDKAAGFV
jgi:hypothetical protein